MRYLCILMLAVFTAVAGCSAGGQQADSVKEIQSVNAAAPVDIKTGVQGVLQELKKMQVYVMGAPKQQGIQQFGKALAEKWDAFEEKVEKSYPAQYEKIEESLYPLIAETGKTEPDMQKIRDLIVQVQKDLSQFLSEVR